VFDLWDRCERLLVLTSPSFDPPPAGVPANVRYVGPICDDPAWVEPWTPPWPLAARPFVLVAMSSTYQAHDGLLRRIVAALDGTEVAALVTLGPGLHAGEVAGTSNVAVATSAPHAELLSGACWPSLRTGLPPDVSLKRSSSKRRPARMPSPRWKLC